MANLIIFGPLEGIEAEKLDTPSNWDPVVLLLRGRWQPVRVLLLEGVAHLVHPRRLDNVVRTGCGH